MASKSSENVYNVDYSKPGLVLIINNQNFVQTEERKGSDKDVDRILDTFENLNFKTRSFMNQTKKQMKDLVETYSKETIQTTLVSFVLLCHMAIMVKYCVLTRCK
jgi:hypothetical protein